MQVLPLGELRTEPLAFSFLPRVGYLTFTCGRPNGALQIFSVYGGGS